VGCNVYANDDEIACKAGAGKVIAAFPDVCLTPPSPPAGPIPVPYPDTSFSKDMQSGSKTVMIKDKEVMLKDQSFYKTSPLGDEAATNGLGAGVVTHVITGKTFFVAWSMDVQFEGQNVDRHTDMTTSNHASPIANAAPPWANISEQTLKDAEKECQCCHAKPPHSSGKPTDGKTWYDHRAEEEGPRKARPAKKDKPEVTARSVAEKQADVAAHIDKAEKRTPCSCPPGTKVLPEAPCNVFYKLPPKPDPVTKKNQMDRSNEQTAMKTASRDAFNPKGGGGIKDKFNQKRVAAGKPACNEVMHLVPISAGGCPGTSDGGNLQCKDDLCSNCKDIDTGWEKGGFQTINFPETSAKL
jgi:hypothetical protein